MGVSGKMSKIGDSEKLSLVGDINEDADIYFPTLLKAFGNKVIVNFKDVSSINSCGVRAWITFLRELEAGRSVTFEECTPDIISQINMIPNFRGKSAVKSVYAGYTCQSCGNAQLHLFTAGKNMPASADSGAGEVACVKCNKPTEMDELEEEFFAWL